MPARTTRGDAARIPVQGPGLSSAAFEALSQGIVVHDVLGTIVECNEAAGRILGLTRDQLCGRTSIDPRWRAVQADGSPYAGEEHPAMRALATGETVRGEVMGVHTPDGRLRWLWVTAVPLVSPENGQRTGVVAGFADVTAQQDLLAELTTVRATLEAVTDNLPDVVVRLAPDGTVEWVSPSLERVLGLRPQQVVGTRDAHIAPGRRAAAAATMADAVERRRGEHRFSTSLRRADGQEIPVDATCRITYDGGGLLVTVVTYRDVTRRIEGQRRLAESEERYRLLAENSSDVVMVIQSGRVQWVSPSLSEVLGWAPEEWIGAAAVDYLHPEDAETILANRDDLLAGRSVMSRRRVRDRAGIYHWVESHSRAFRYDDGTVNGVQSAFRLIDTEVATENELLHRAQHDALTGLLTTTELRDRLATLLWGRRAADSSVAVLFCDLDDFKAINDAHGHAAGDQVLRAVAERITEVLRDDDLVGRMGGDEMAVVLVGVATVDEATTIADGIRAAVRRAVTDLEATSPTASVGVALARPGDTVDELLTRADLAMYAAKEQGKDRVAVAT